jgi:DNA-binding NarL/FixJ family response regulator
MTPGPGALRVVLADDDFLVREGVARLLADGPDVHVVAAVATATELLAVCRRERPDAVLTDIRMPPGMRTDGIEAALELRRGPEPPGVVVLSQHVADSYALQLFADGTTGLAYLLKERISDRDEIVRALRATAEGGSAIDPVVVEHLLQRERRARSSPLAELTPRELQVLHEMAQGRTNPWIAGALHLSESAVSKHIAAVFTKLGLQEQGQVDRRVSAVITYLREARSTPSEGR